jgi:hypothetical protein
MNATSLSMPHAGGIRVPVTVRTLAMRSLAAAARTGAVACDARRLRERTVNWLALAMLLAAWNVEARLSAGDVTPPGGTLNGGTPQTAGLPPGGFDWTEPRTTRWTSCAAHNLRQRGADDR